MGSRAKVRVLRSIALHDGLNLSRIRSEANLPWKKADKMLGEFVEAGILREHRYSCMRGRYIRMFRYRDTPRARLLKQLFQEWERC